MQKLLSKIAGVPITVLTSETHTYTSEVTQNPLEDGSIITDHIIEKPLTLRVEIAITNTDQNNKTIFNSFVQKLKNRSTLTLNTEHQIYKNMVLTSFTPTHSAPYKGAFTATLVFTQLRYYNAVANTNTNTANTSVKGGEPLVQRGTTNTDLNKYTKQPQDSFSV